MISRKQLRVSMIPLDRIHVINPRSRAKLKFRQIVANIGKLGLKRPIVVAARKGKDNEAHFDLVCGQGRLEAFRALAQPQVPAMVIDASQEDILLMSLTENLARRRHSCVEVAREIVALKDRGNSVEEIARKTDLSPAYVRGMIRLLKNGEERLIQSVEWGRIPINIALTIAGTDDQAIQRGLTEAYEKGELRGKALLYARRLVEKRQLMGKNGKVTTSASDRKKISSENILRTYQRETTRQNHFLQKARICESRWEFVITAIKTLATNEGFVNLLRAEGLDTLPKPLAERIAWRSR